MSDGRTFGEAVREARVARGMSMEQLGAAVGRSATSVRRWERGEGMPSEAVKQRVLSLLGIVEVGEAVTGEPAVGAAEQGAESPVPESMRATSVAAPRAAPPDEPVRERAPGPLQRFLDPEKPWLGLLRAFLTIVVLGMLAWLLVWAAAGLVDVVGTIWRSLWSSSPAGVPGG